MKKIEYLNPFGRMCVSMGMIPSTYKESLTYEEQLLWLINYLETKVIPIVNNNSEVTEELQQYYVELKQYVTDYFTNLDTQEEINNKLDDMAEDGTLERIINEELFSELSSKYENTIVNYNVLQDMVEDETLQDGNTVYVKGLNTLGDGFSGLYNISESGVTNSYYCILLDNGLYATLQNDIENNFYKEITFDYHRVGNTNYYLTRIPKYDNDGNLIKLYVSKRTSGLSNNEDAQLNNTNVTINGALSFLDSSDNYIDGSIIMNGTIERDISPLLIPNDLYYLGIKNDNSIKSYKGDATTAQNMIDDGVIQAFLVFGQSVTNGVYADIGHYETKGPGQYIGQKSNGDIIILTNDGRNEDNEGFTGQEGSEILINEGCNNVWILDGGGSTSTSFKGTKINMNVDDNGRTDRRVNYLLNVKKTIVNKSTADIYSFIGKVKQNIIEELIGLINLKGKRTGIVKLRNTDTQLIESNNQKLLLYLSSPSTNLVNITKDSSNTYVDNITLKNKGYISINATFQVQNNDNSNSNNVYIDFVQGTNILFTLGGSLEKGEFKPLTLCDTFNIELTIDQPLFFQLRASANNKVQITRCEVSYTIYQW